MYALERVNRHVTAMDPQEAVISSPLALAFPFVIGILAEFGLDDVIRLAPVGTAVTAGIALAAFVRNSRLEHDRLIFEQATTTLEQAYEALSAGVGVVSATPSRRYAWLTAARMLLSYRNLQSKIKTSLYAGICSAREDYWRHRFYSVMQDPLERYLDFFGLNDAPPDCSPCAIEPRSALVVLAFAAMRSDVDIIDGIDTNQCLDEVRKLKRPLAEAFLRKWPKYLNRDS